MPVTSSSGAYRAGATVPTGQKSTRSSYNNYYKHIDNDRPPRRQGKQKTPKPQQMRQGNNKFEQTSRQAHLKGCYRDLQNQNKRQLDRPQPARQTPLPQVLGNEKGRYSKQNEKTLKQATTSAVAAPGAGSDAAAAGANNKDKALMRKLKSGELKQEGDGKWPWLCDVHPVIMAHETAETDPNDLSTKFLFDKYGISNLTRDEWYQTGDYWVYDVSDASLLVSVGKTRRTFLPFLRP
jgi:hypothetical protein